ncbi:MAG TPA: hypothetical protein VJB59_10085 [Bdellovibrionota bacterium]|nr:hypothetical protein [Bdellovibrionota bacterium]
MSIDSIRYIFLLFLVFACAACGKVQLVNQQKRAVSAVEPVGVHPSDTPAVPNVRSVTMPASVPVTILSGGGISTGPGVQLRSTVGDVTADPSVRSASGVSVVTGAEGSKDVP